MFIYILYKILEIWNQTNSVNYQDEYSSKEERSSSLFLLDGSKIFSYSKSFSRCFKFKMHQQSISIYCSDKGYDNRMTHSLTQLTRINEEKRFPEKKVVDQEVNETL